MNKLTLFSAHLIAFVILCGSPFAHTSSTTTLDLNQSVTDVLGTDPALHIGTLKNGLRYYIRKNTRPEKQATFKLVIHAGSANEQDHEQGLAHLLEHVVHKGTPTFTNQTALNAYFNTYGIDMRADSNASTNLDQTEYFFTVPTDNEQLLTTTITFLSEVAGTAFLRDTDIDQERSIVLDELQMRNSVGFRQSKALM